MSEYEHVVDGQVTERVTTVDGSNEDTRLGVAALDRAPGTDGWRVAGTVDPVPERQPDDESDAPKEPPADEKPKLAAPKPKPQSNQKD